MSYREEDSVRGLITFCQNRVSWTTLEHESEWTQQINAWGDKAVIYFFNQFQVAADQAGARRVRYLTKEVDDDFRKMAESYEQARDDMLLANVKASEVLVVMDMAKIVWKSAREQFKYALAMNDIITKAYLQLRESDDEDDRQAYDALQEGRPKIRFNASGDTEFEIHPEEFWRLFTGPSLDAFLHYSVNSYTNDPMVLESPLAESIQIESENNR